METEDTDDPAYVRSVLENLPGVDPGADETPKSRREKKWISLEKFIVL